MNRIKAILGRLVQFTILVAVAIGVMYKMRVNIPALNTAKLYAHIDYMGVCAQRQYEPYFPKHEAEAHHENHRVVVTSPVKEDVIITHAYVCQIHSRKHIEVCALEDGYLETIPIQE